MGIANQISGIAELASEHGEVVDQLLEFVHWFMLVLFVGWSVFLAIALWKFHHSRNKKASYYGVQNHASSHIEIAVILTEAVLLLGFAYPLWSHRVDDFPTGNDVVRIRAVGEQFRWLYQYAGPDGKFGATDNRDITAANPIGIDHDDPNAKDDFVVVNDLVVPLDRKVIIGVTAKDVIHNLALIPMRIAQDAIPGTEAHVWFTPTKVGTWDVVCGQLCGSGHGVMASTIEVKTPTDFDTWFKEKVPAAPAAPAPAAADTATPAEPKVAGN